MYLVARGLPGIVAFLAIPLFTRLLDPASYGRYALVVATVGLLNALLFQWLRLSLVRYLPAFKQDEAKLKGTLLTTAFIVIGGLGAIAAAATMLPGAAAWRDVILLGWTVLAVQAVFELCCEYSRASLNPWQFMVLQLARSAASVGLGALLIKLGIGWWGPLVGVAIGMVIGIGYAYWRDWTDVRFAIDRQTLATLCRYGLPLSLTVTLAIVIATSDRFLIAYFHGEDAAGLYSVAVDLTSQTLTLLMMVINLAMFPIAVRAFESQGPEAARERMTDNASLLLAVGLPCVVGLCVLAPGIASCLLGSSYRDAAVSVIPLVAVGAFLAGLKAYHFDAAFQFAHQTIYQVWIVLAVAVSNIAINLIVIPRWGIGGAAVSSVLAYVLSIAITGVVGRRHFAMPFPSAAAVRVSLACAAMAAALLPFRAHTSPAALTVQVVGGALLYAAVLIATNFLGLRDLIGDRLLVRAALERPGGVPRADKSDVAQLAETN